MNAGGASLEKRFCDCRESDEMFVLLRRFVTKRCLACSVCFPEPPVNALPISWRPLDAPYGVILGP